ncbi:hypothetical protein [Nocardioides sp. CER19]|uniref:hypothetical protein n=1 Tax=Nocardioides sp. CER19 TaxID=3038538 RepID=UPI002449DBFB|nr:hypothetical protein [Nocardioides sp. CER19]MDH2415191.1 hypothetical protein [Nocardioides sp. CER19]
MEPPSDAAVAASGSWVDAADRYRSPAGLVHAWLPHTNQTPCGIPLKEVGPARFPHIEWADVQPATGRDADQVQEVCPRWAAGTGRRRDDRSWRRTDRRP